MFRRTLLSITPLAVVFALAGFASAQEPKKDEPAAKEVKLRWYGQSMFQLEHGQPVPHRLRPARHSQLWSGAGAGRLRAHQPSAQRP